MDSQFWYSVCCANGFILSQTGYKVWVETHTWGHLAVFTSQSVYTALFVSDTSIYRF